MIVRSSFQSLSIRISQPDTKLDLRGASSVTGFRIQICLINKITLVYSITRQIWGIWKLRPTYSPEKPDLGQNGWCFVPCDIDIWWMTLKNNRASLLCCFKFVQHFIAIDEFKLELQSGNAQFGSKSTIFVSLWPWNLTDDIKKQ